MARRIISQRRGRGSPTYRVPEYSFKPSVRYNNTNGRIVDIVRDPIRNAPLAKVLYEDRTKGHIIAPEGIKVGDNVELFVMPLSKIAIGKEIFGIESYPNSGPKLCRTSGSCAMLVSKSKGKCVIQLPSKQKKVLNSQCRATLGIPAGEGRADKPWLKAGKKWIAMHRRGKLYPRTSGVAMNAVDHPFGSGYSGIGRQKTVARNAPPGRKVGSIAAKRTGKRRGKR